MPPRVQTPTPVPARPQVPTSALLVIEDGRNPIDAVAKTLDSRMDQIVGMYSGDAAMADRMKWVTLHALAHPKLLDKLMQADLATVIEAIRESASLGLMPIPATAEGYLVPRWNKDKRLYDFTFMPGYRGLVKLIHQSNRVAKIIAHVVYENDEFDYETSEGYVRHKPALTGRGQVIATYGKATILTDGHAESVIEIFDEDRMAKTRNSSSSRNGKGDIIGPWIDWPDEMRRKTVIRNMSKTLPLSYVAEEAIRMENEHEERYQPMVQSGEPTKQSRLRAAVASRLPSLTPGDVPEPGGPSGTAPSAPGAPEGSGEPLRTVCGAAGPGEDVICDLDPDHDGPHESEDAPEPWD